MNQAGIKKLILKGEGISIEFKECRNKLNKDVFESICAFLNRNSGDLLLGVNDKGRITGIAPEAVERVKNPVIARFFKEIGCADELGSGVRKLFKYCRHYSGGKTPELIEIFSSASSPLPRKLPCKLPCKMNG
ncbi:MAG: putative DNA binding domain-containing protein [Desulfobacterales bacterium]|nr:putative DNA binding domain-containing protein [Desulfobacterales bacterium]